MLCDVIAAGMKEPLRGRERVHNGPEVPLKPIAGGAAVDQIVQIIPTTSRTRSEMINLEFATSLGLMNATVTATRAISLAGQSHLNRGLAVCARGGDTGGDTP